MIGRIPQSFLDDLLSRTDIVELIGERVELRRSGANHMARCPFHDEKTPSFSVNQDRQFYYCFGCNAGGNAIGFVMAYDHLDFIGAVRLLAARAGLDIPREADSAPDQNAPLLALLERAGNFYLRQLQDHPAARGATAYLKRRGVSPEIAREFALGFAPPGWENLLGELAPGGQQSEIGQLVAAGLAIARDPGPGHYDRFRHRLMFPIRDLRGRTLGFGGRVLGDEQPKYLNSPETAVFHKGRELYGLYEARQHLRNGVPILVVEGYLDVLALAQFGIRNAVATLGTTLTEDHLHKLFRHTSDLIFCFDGDVAGRRAARRALDLCLPALRDGRTARFLFLPEGDDPDTAVRRLGGDPFRKLVDTAMPLSEFLFQTASADLDWGLPDHRARICQRALPLVNRLPPGMLRQLLLNDLAERTGLSLDTFRQFGGTKAGSPQQPSVRPPPETPQRGPALRQESRPQRGHRMPLTHQLLALLLHDTGLCTPLGEALQRLRPDNPDCELVRNVHKALMANPDYSLVHLLSYWQGLYGPAQRELLARIAASDLMCQLPGTERDNLAEARALLTRLLEAQEREQPPAARLRTLLARDQLATEDQARVRALILELSRESPQDPMIQEAKQRVAASVPGGSGAPQGLQ